MSHVTATAIGFVAVLLWALLALFTAGSDPVPPFLLNALTFAIGAGLAACAGMMTGFYYGSVRYDMGFVPGIKAFAAAVLGGIGNVTGAMLGGAIIGMVEVFGAAYISGQYKDVFAFIIMIAVLYFKPTGIMGENVDDTRV